MVKNRVGSGKEIAFIREHLIPALREIVWEIPKGTKLTINVWDRERSSDEGVKALSCSYVELLVKGPMLAFRSLAFVFSENSDDPELRGRIGFMIVSVRGFSGLEKCSYLTKELTW